MAINPVVKYQTLDTYLGVPSTIGELTMNSSQRRNRDDHAIDRCNETGLVESEL